MTNRKKNIGIFIGIFIGIIICSTALTFLIGFHATGKVLTVLFSIASAITMSELVEATRNSGIFNSYLFKWLIFLITLTLICGVMFMELKGIIFGAIIFGVYSAVLIIGRL